MATKRITPDIVRKLSPTVLYVLGDEVLYPEPDNLNTFDRWSLRHPTAREECRKLWEAGKDQVLRDWITRYPGTRPLYWWLFDAPRMSAAEVEACGWTGAYFVPYLPDPRERLSGTGIEAWQIERNLRPYYRYGVPDGFRRIDPADPPQYESQASYLRRHGLLTADEAARLTRRDFAPETISVA